MPPKKQKKAAPTIPDKLYFKIGEVADIVGVKPYVLRYWETEFPEIAPSKSKSKQRLYKRKEVDLILNIRNLLYDHKFTIAGARRQIKDGQKRGKSSEKEKQITLPLATSSLPKGPIKALKKKLDELRKILE